jgi:hypothetical protein
MLGIKDTAKTSTLWRCTASAAGECWSLVEGVYYKVVGTMPSDLMPFLVPCTSDDAVDSRTVIVLDGAMISARIRRAPVENNRPQRITKAALLKRFGWSESEFETAQRIGLPPAHQVISDNALQLEPRAEWFRSSDEVERWIADIVAVAGGLRR